MAKHGNTKHGHCSEGKNTPAYDCWANMMARCNNPKNTAYRFYGERGVTVCTEWHQFETFLEWYKNHYPKDGQKYQLDKDIKGEDLKVYSPSTCTFISQKENVVKALAKTWLFIDPEGNKVRVYNLQEFCRKQELTQANMWKVHSGERVRHKQWRKFNETNECT